MRRFGTLRHCSAGDYLYRAGSVSPGMFVFLSGTVRVIGRDGLGRERVVRANMQRGEFSSDIGQLSGKPALVDACVIEDVEALVLTAEGLRALMVAEAELGERLTRALILRRVAAIERGDGPVLVGAMTILASCRCAISCEETAIRMWRSMPSRMRKPSR